MCLYVTVVMYLHVSAMSVESRCFPQFLLRSLGGILGDSSLHQQRVPQCLLRPRGRPQLQSELGPRQMLQDASTPTENSASGLGASDEFSSSLEGKLMLDVAIWRKAPKISSDLRWAKADKDVGKKPAAHCTNKGFRNVCCGLEGGLNCKASWVRGKCSKMHPLQPKTLLPVWVHQMNSVQAWKASWCWMLPYDAKHPRSVPIWDGRRLTKMWGKNLQLIAPTKGSTMSAAA